VRTALDTNILSGLISDEPQSAAITAILGNCLREGPIVISPIVYAELLANPAVTIPFLELFLSNTSVTVDYQMEESIWQDAGTRYARYAVRRRRATGEGPRRLIADFVIGAHALARADRLLTLDKRVYAQDFPELRLHPGLAL